MKKVFSFSFPVMVCLITCLTWSCSTKETDPSPSFLFVKEASTKTADLNKKEPIVFNTIATSSEGSTYFGTVAVSGGINATGTYVMPTETLGMALHCTLILTLPEGSITIRMNCNMKTSEGQWKILAGSGSYQNLEGGGSLVMPDDIREILTGSISWK
ncbi:hypothetical protein [Rufibacter roseolus]|uniref:hypothetical protein n=1 Tax=Rufibacter roseolus TaxID=2817375 RepID=UPI001B314190|nr:hypothetical protein [Rufibacter roseolus]